MQPDIIPLDHSIIGVILMMTRLDLIWWLFLFRGDFPSHTSTPLIIPIVIKRTLVIHWRFRLWLIGFFLLFWRRDLIESQLEYWLLDRCWMIKGMMMMLWRLICSQSLVRVRFCLFLQLYLILLQNHRLLYLRDDFGWALYLQAIPGEPLLELNACTTGSSRLIIFMHRFPMWLLYGRSEIREFLFSWGWERPGHTGLRPLL